MTALPPCLNGKVCSDEKDGLWGPRDEPNPAVSQRASLLSPALPRGESVQILSRGGLELAFDFMSCGVGEWRVRLTSIPFRPETP